MNEELDLKQIVKYIYERKNILAYILLISIVIGIFYTFIIKRPEYKITAEILIDKADTSIEDFVSGKDIINGRNIESSFDKTSKTITVFAFPNKKEKEQALNEINSYISEIQVKLDEIYNTKTFTIIEKPQIPQKPTNASYIKDIGVCALVGILVYGAYIVVLFTLRGVTSSLEIENTMNINVLGEISLEKKKDKNQRISYNTKNKVIMDQLKRVEANIELNKENQKPKTILVTGTEKSVGTSYIVNNLASQYAKLYNKVLIIDADNYAKTLTNFYGKNGENGLTNILELKEVSEVEKVIQETGNGNVFFLPLGNNLVEEDIFLKDDIKNVLVELQKEYDIILIDSPSINNHISPIHLTNIADGTVLVIESGKTKQEQIQKAKSTIEKVGGKITGIIINKMF